MHSAQCNNLRPYFHTILMVHCVICICLTFASCHLSSIKYCQSATKHCPCIITFALSLAPFLAHLPVFVVCGCLDEAGGEDQQSDHCICFQFPLTDLPSPLGLLMPSSPLSLSVFPSPCPPNCRLDFLFVYLLVCLSVVWQPAKFIL